MKFVIELIATIFFVGYLPASGTFATLVSFPLVIWINNQNIILRIILISVFCFVSIFVASLAEKEVFKKKDDRRIVIDEMFGFIVAMLGIEVENLNVLFLGFIIFRILDIYKLSVIKKLQEFKLGLGVVIDDFLCGVITNIILRILLVWL